MRRFYFLMCVIGTVIPGAFFGAFFAANGLDIILFLKSLFANGAAGGFSADVLISIPVVWVWSFLDAGKAGVKRWWWVLPASFFVGLSLALPLYLYLRAKAEDV